MTKNEARARIEKLRKEINHHRTLYHVYDTVEISDAALDSLKHELERLEGEFPDLITPDSPTQRVGGKVRAGFHKVAHPTPILSLVDAFSEDEVVSWIERNGRLLKEPLKGFFGEPKMDGLALVLRYDDGVFAQGLTRGDGTLGEDVTHTVRTIESIPLRLEEKGLKRMSGQKTLWVRGEAVITQKELVRINKERKKNSEPLFANARNLAAGTIRQLDPNVAAGRELIFFAFDVLTDSGLKTHADVHSLLHDLGFKVSELCRESATLKDIVRYYRFIESKRKNLPFEIDGVVIVANDRAQERELGSIGKADRWMLAYKFPGEQATTVVEDIIVQVGRTGALTPVAVLRPVFVRGVTITHATLHNADQISRLGIRIGDTVIVERAGDVIPAVVAVLPRMRTGKERAFHMPKACPVCGQNVVQRTTHIREGKSVAFYCSNRKCYAQRRRRIIHFTRKGAFDIEGIGEKTVDRFLERGLITDPASIFELKREDIVSLEGFGEKSAENVVMAIDKRKNIELARFLFALGIQHVGAQTAIDVSVWIASKQNPTTPRQLFGFFSKISPETLQEISEVGTVVAASIHFWFQDPENQKIIERLSDVGIRFAKTEVSLRAGFFAGKTVVFTGTLARLSREDAESIIRAQGGKAVGTVSKKTDFVVLGENPGSKYEKAEVWGVRILTEPEFLKMVEKEKGSRQGPA